VYGDGKVYVTGQDGVIVVLKEGPELKVLSKNDMQEAVIGTPALADGKIYIRTRTKLYCIAK
jgi:outer membrane protein assembly factor BamB